MSDAVEPASPNTPAGLEPAPEPTCAEVESPTLSQAAQAVYRNDLIMSLVYRFVTKRGDLASCLLVSKEGYDAAAKEFFFKTSTKAMSRLFDEGCSFERLTEIFARVKIIDAPKGETFPYSRYPNLAMLRLRSLLSRHHVVTFQEIIHRDQRPIVLEHGYDGSSAFLWDEGIAAGDTPAGTIPIGADLLSITFHPGLTDGSLAICKTAVKGFMAAIRAALKADKLDGRFARIKRLATTDKEGVFTPADMTDILRVCTSLTSLEIALNEVEDDGNDDNDNEDDGNEDDYSEYRVSLDSLRDFAPRLEVISLRGIELCNLDCILECKHVTIRTGMYLYQDWLMEFYLTLPLDERPEPSRYMESLTIELESGSSSCFVIAQFLLCVINKRTVVKIIPSKTKDDTNHDYSTTRRRAEEVSETLSLLRQIRACEEPSTPGYRHLGSSDDSPSRQDTPETL